MSKKRKICVVITARPSYSRIKTALLAIQNHPDLELQVVAAASALLDKYGNVAEAMKADGFELAAEVFMMLEGENLLTSVKSTGYGLAEMASTFSRLQPDIVVTIADRFETIATAIAASYMNIPLAHVQGGEITGSIDEKVRHAVTKLADIHLVSNELAKSRVTRMGERESAIHNTGCPSIDLAADVLAQPELDFDPIQKYMGVGGNVAHDKDYVVCLQHPVTTEYKDSKEYATKTLRAIRNVDIPTYLFWPNVDAGSDGTSKAIRIYREECGDDKIHFFKSMLPKDFLRLLYNSRCIIGNSSVAIRECSFLGVPAVNIGTRQQGRLRGKNVYDVDYSTEQITKAILAQTHVGRFDSEPIYGDGKSGTRIAEVLAKAPLTVTKMLTY